MTAVERTYLRRRIDAARRRIVGPVKTRRPRSSKAIPGAWMPQCSMPTVDRQWR